MEEEEPPSLLKGFEWPTEGLAQRIPNPNFTTGTVANVSETSGTSLSIRMEDVDEKEAAAFVQSLKDAGYCCRATEVSGNTSYNYQASDHEPDVDVEVTSVSVNYRVTVTAK